MISRNLRILQKFNFSNFFAWLSTFIFFTRYSAQISFPFYRKFRIAMFLAHAAISQKNSKFRRCAFSTDSQRRCLTLHLRRFLRRLRRHWGRKPDRLVASGGSNFIRFSPIDSILNLEDSRGSILHLSRCDRRHRRRLSLVFALVGSFPSSIVASFQLSSGTPVRTMHVLKRLQREHRDVQCF